MASNQDQYEVVRPIGSGAFGQVYLVFHKIERKTYVMKEIASVASMDDKQRESTELEVELLRAMSHPNIVGYRDSFMNDQGHLAIFMEFCELGDMHTYLQDGRKVGKSIGEARVLEWFVQIVLALHALHTKKILHRDLKTQNIFLTGTINADTIALKLGDFGIAKVLDSTDLAMTQIGTPFYMSPELFNNKPYGYKSDIWGLGCVLYEIINGQRPFEGQSINGLALKVLQGRYTSITAACTEETKNLIKSLLSTNPAHRPTLQEILHNPSIRRRILTAMQTVLVAGAPDAKAYIESVLKDQLTALGLGGLVDNSSGAGPRRDSRHILQKLEHAERRRKREEDTLRRLQETAGLLAHYLNEGMPQAVGSHLSMYNKKRVDLDDSDEIEAVEHCGNYWSEANLGDAIEANLGEASWCAVKSEPTIAHTASDNLPRVTRVKLPVDLPAHQSNVDDPNPPAMSHRDRVLLRKEQRREEEQQRFEEEARKIREENLAYQRAWVQDARDQWGQPFATARSFGAVSNSTRTTMWKDSNPATTTTSHQQRQQPYQQQVPPLGAFGGNSINYKPLPSLLNNDNQFQSYPKTGKSPRRHESPREPKPPKPHLKYRQEPNSPREAPPHSTGRWSHWSKSDHPYHTARSLNSVSLEPLSNADGFDKHPEPSDDSGIEMSDDALSDVGGRHWGTEDQVRKQSRIVQQRIDACRAAIYRHRMTIETLQYTVSQQQGNQDPYYSTSYSDHHPQHRSSDTFYQESEGRRRSQIAIPATVQDRIKRLRRSCIDGLGSEIFQDARQSLQELSECGAAGEAIREMMLGKLGLDKIGFYSLIDQIVYMECRFGEQELA